MKVATATLKSQAPYHQSKQVVVEKLEKEAAQAYEDRTWRERCHYDPETRTCFIPNVQFRNALSDIGGFLGLKIQGKGNHTWKKHFQAGIMVKGGGIDLGVKVDDVEGLPLSVPADGKSGGSKRVKRTFPMFNSWAGEVEFIILDDIIDEDTFKYHLTQAGMLVGIGAFRPINRGWCGRFTLESMTWGDYDG